MIDDDGGGDFDLIGEAYTTMGNIMGAKAQMFTANLTKGGGSSSQGQLIVRAETVQHSNTTAKFSYRWQNLNNLSNGFIGIGRKRMSVRFEIGRLIPGTQNYAEIATTNHIKQHKSPDFKIPLQQHSLAVLCNNNRDQKIRFSAWTKDNRMLNAIYVTINQLSESNQHTFNGKEGT